MYVIESINRKQNFIYSIKVEEKKANEHLKRLNTKNDNTQIKKISFDKFPLYIIEKQNSFSYVSKQQLVNEINEILENKKYKTFDEDFVLFCFYIIENEIEFDFDEMGRLNHYHADKYFFEKFAKYGNTIL